MTASSVFELAVRVNETQKEATVENRTLLAEFLREQLGLTGTHVGCDTSQCGACVVLVNGRSVKSCTMLAVQAHNCDITTIEGLAGADGAPHPMQAMFREHHALQCGFCTPGMIMSATDLIRNAKGALTEDDIRHFMEGNICRCTGYHNIVRAIRAAAELMHPSAAATSPRPSDA
jgi:carbon-monoxide dehydrogenase small subunit